MTEQVISASHETLPRPDFITGLGITTLDEGQQGMVLNQAEQFAALTLDPKRVAGVDPFDNYSATEEVLQTIANIPGNEITPAHAAVNRLFTGALFDRISSLERMGRQGDAQQLASAAYESFFSSSPNIASYSGSPAEQFRLLALAQATPLTRQLSGSLVGELTYATSFGYSNDVFLKGIQGQTPTAALQAIHASERIARWAVGNGEWADPAVGKVLFALDHVAAAQDNTHFIRTVAAAMATSLRTERGQQWVDITELPQPEQQRLWQDHQARQERRASSQQRIRRQFPELEVGDAAQLIQLARDAAAVMEHGSLGEVAYRASDDNVLRDRIDTIAGSRVLGLTAEQSLLLSELHQTNVRSLVEADLGVELSAISLGAQLHLLEYLTSADTGRYERLGALIRQAPGTKRGGLCESFLALEFGKDFGDILLEVGDRFHDRPEELTETLGTLQDIRHSAEQIARHFLSEHELDQRLAPTIDQAFIKRITESLVQIADTIPERQGQGLAVLRLMAFVMQEAKRGLDGPFTDNISAEDSYETYRSLTAPLAVTVRPRGANARIGLTVNIPNEQLPAELQGKRRRVSVRLDMEDGGLSLDLGSTAQHDVNASPAATFIGTALAEGEALLAHRRALRGIQEGAERQDITLHGNHVREVFPADLRVTSEVFEGLARRFASRLQERRQHQTTVA